MWWPRTAEGAVRRGSRWGASLVAVAGPPDGDGEPLGGALEVVMVLVVMKKQVTIQTQGREKRGDDDGNVRDTW